MQINETYHTWTARHVQNQLDKFQNWLARAGAEVLMRTSAWELVRFRDGRTTSIIYTNAKGDVTFTGTSRRAWDAFKSNQSWSPDQPKAKRVNGKLRRNVVDTIRARDGSDCFFCARPVDGQHESVEHLVSIADGGPNHISNMFLAHVLCNNDAGKISAVEKIKMYHTARIKYLIQRRDPGPGAPQGLARRLSDAPKQPAPLIWEEQ